MTDYKKQIVINKQPDIEPQAIETPIEASPEAPQEPAKPRAAGLIEQMDPNQHLTVVRDGVERVIVNVLEMGKKAPNKLPEDGVIPFDVLEGNGQFSHRAYKLEELLNQVENLVRRGSARLDIDKQEGTWTVTTHFGGKNSGTLFQPPHVILREVMNHLKVIDASKELDQANWVDDQFNLKRPA